MCTPHAMWVNYTEIRCQSDSTAFPSFLATYGTRLLAEPLSCRLYSQTRLESELLDSIQEEFSEKFSTIGTGPVYVPQRITIRPG